MEGSEAMKKMGCRTVFMGMEKCSEDIKYRNVYKAIVWFHLKIYVSMPNSKVPTERSLFLSYTQMIVFYVFSNYSLQ